MIKKLALDEATVERTKTLGSVRLRLHSNSDTTGLRWQEPTGKHESVKDPTPATSSPTDLREQRLFRSLDLQNEHAIRVGDFMKVLNQAGLGSDDRRLRQTVTALGNYTLNDKLSEREFCDLIRPNILLVERALQGNLVIPDFQEFSEQLHTIFQDTTDSRDGSVADYIPQLSRVDPELYAAALCTIDGQRWATGDSTVDFCVQSCCKPITYCLALEERGEDYVHQFVGREPSGRNFNDLMLSDEGKPHNPMINAGAIMCSALIRQELDVADRFDYIRAKWQALCGDHRVGFNNAVYQSERATADRNFALGYYMRERGAFPSGTDLLQTLDLYFQSCSIELNAETMAILAATLANGGVCPATGERILKMKNVRDCLSLMFSCGMYDYSGEFAFTIGLPAKSGVSGVLMVVIPNVMGLCLWSPRVDSHGNTVRGIDFCSRLVTTFNFHNYDNLSGESEKQDPRINRTQRQANKVNELIWAASKGDQGAVHRLVVRGFDQDAADYDHRTALHLASAEGREAVVSYLVENGANVNPRDRWGGTPLDDAYRYGYSSVAKFLEEHGAVRGHSADALKVFEKDSIEQPAGSESESDSVVELIYAASAGDLNSIQQMVARGVDLGRADYDMRTPLHLAAAEGHEHVVQYFIDQGLALSPQDRWGGTPLSDARRHGHLRVSQLLEQSDASA